RLSARQRKRPRRRRGLFTSGGSFALRQVRSGTRVVGVRDVEVLSITAALLAQMRRVGGSRGVDDLPRIAPGERVGRIAICRGDLEARRAGSGVGGRNLFSRIPAGQGLAL